MTRYNFASFLLVGGSESVTDICIFGTNILFWVPDSSLISVISPWLILEEYVWG